MWQGEVWAKEWTQTLTQELVPWLPGRQLAASSLGQGSEGLRASATESHQALQGWLPSRSHLVSYFQ